MSRAPRGLTRTQELRQAKSAAYVREREQKEQTRTQREMPVRRKRPPAPEPKKVDFSKPGMTKSMLARMKLAEKFKQDYERKKAEEIESTRRPKRTPAPIGGDARMGRERTLSARRPSTGRLDRTRGARSPEPAAGRSQFQSVTPSRRGAIPRSGRLQPPVRSTPGVPEKVAEMARVMNADVVQAEPIGEGPIDRIVIPPGTISDNRTTIVSILPPTADLDATGSQVANRSIQVISETLDEQDAVEAAAVQCRLEDLQQARREFVMAVANVGGNAVNIGDEAGDLPLPPSLPVRLPSSPVRPPPPPQPPQKYIYKIPDVTTDERFQYTYGLDHPTVVAAREYARRSMAAMEQQKLAKRMEDEFERIARQPPPQDLRLDVPFEEEMMYGGDISWEEDEETGLDFPCLSRIKTTMPTIPTRQETYQYSTFDPDDLERFFDVQNYPPCPRPPPGREHLHPDLWDLDDPWYRPAEPPPDVDVDLIDFDDYC